MNLQDAKKTVIDLQRALGLNPNTVPETEFLAELHFIAKYIEGTHARISMPQNDTFRSNGDPELPGNSIMVMPEDSSKNILKLVYYGGDNIPVGPRHGLAITLIPQSQILYWREHRQNPSNQWVTNILAQGQNNFEFAPYTIAASFREFIQNDGIIQFLKIDSSAKFLVESAYLNCWNTMQNEIPVKEGISFHSEFNYTNNEVIITIECNNYEDIEPLSFIYNVGPELNQYGLLILEGDSVVYERSIEQDEATEWLQNCMANDPSITDEDGNILFVGDPIQE